MVIDDLNAKVGIENSDLERAIGKNDAEKKNKNEERLVDFYL